MMDLNVWITIVISITWMIVSSNAKSQYGAYAFEEKLILIPTQRRKRREQDTYFLY